MLQQQSSSKQKHFHNVFSFTDKLDAKPTKKKQQGRPKRQKQPTKTTTELTNVDSQFADIDSDDEIELVMEISHSSHHHQEKPSKILKLDNSSAEKETNDDGEINMDKDGDKSVHLEVLEKMNEEFRQEEDYKPVVAMDCQNLKRNFFKTNLQNIDINNNDDDHPMDSSILYTRRCLRAIRGFHDLNPRTQKTIREDIDRCERLKMKKKSLKEFLAKMSITSDRLILDIDKQNEKILIEVDEGFVQILKSHQRDGIQFMFDCTIESVDRLKNHCHQTGCILAHSMGLGKTLQAVAYLHTIMTNQHTARFIRKALIIVPYNVHKNWQDEIQKWLDECRRYFNIVRYDLSRSKSISERLATIKDWHQTGGILVMTIGTYTRLVLGRSFHEEESPEGMAIVKDCLLTPDVFIMDEGHLLKNSSSQINRATSLIVTSRRIILTGTPMQNNLEEYFVMVDFVKPNLLGTIHEFRNRFINPITNGQHIDSTDFDVNFMKKRVHVLFKMLQPSIHRCDYQVLVPDLPPKQEYIVYLQLTDIQAKLYQYYLDNITKKSQQNLFKDFWVLLLLNNHPALLIDMYEKQYDVRMDNDYTIAQNDDYNNNNRSPTINDLSMTKRKTFSRNKNNNNKQQQWWTAIIDERYNIRCMELSSKFIIMFEIIGECQKLNDKLVIFSQSLINLDMIELMLSKCSNCDWSRDVDYFRIDGKVTVETRHRIIQTFNDESNKKARLLLLSTRSGGIGINLVGANRCIIFDCSWNPALDTQAIFRIFRYGQRKPCFVYRLAGFGTMENRIYQRQVAKLSTSKRVVDEKQIRRYFTLRQLEELYTFMRKPLYPQTLPVPRDDLLASLIRKYPGHILLYYEHDSLLQNRPEEELNENEKQQAWIDWEHNRNGNAKSLDEIRTPLDDDDDDDYNDQFDDPDDYRSLLY
ncbi:transcriptional regulator ATRX homolog [Dermatophagoides farinae]|uniref:transcriptional regulator ATRX homolog n=1 Tax=Dermatophagoides farinae TaxID=6954 RepID=UPI003F5F9C1C